MTTAEAEAALTGKLYFADAEHFTAAEGCEVARCTLVDAKARVVGEQVILSATSHDRN